jgi:DNA-binding transcriptional MerR regulator
MKRSYSGTKGGIYSIGQTERIVNLPAHTLRYLEEKGLVSPIRDKVNNYRFYTSEHIKTLIEYRWYRDAGFSVAESVDAVRRTDLFTIEPKLRDSQTYMMCRIEELKLLVERIKDYRKKLSMNFLSEHMHAFDIAYSPEMYHCSFSQYSDGRQVYRSADELAEWFESFEDSAITFFDYLFTLRMSEDGKALSDELPTWGFGIEKRWADALGSKSLTLFPKLPSTRCVRTFIRLDVNEPVKDVIYIQIVLPILEHGYTIPDDIWGNQVAFIEEGGRGTIYAEVWVPIAK